MTRVEVNIFSRRPVVSRGKLNPSHMLRLGCREAGEPHCDMNSWLAPVRNLEVRKNFADKLHVPAFLSNMWMFQTAFCGCCLSLLVTSVAETSTILTILCGCFADVIVMQWRGKFLLAYNEIENKESETSKTDSWTQRMNG